MTGLLRILKRPNSNNNKTEMFSCLAHGIIRTTNVKMRKGGKNLQVRNAPTSFHAHQQQHLPNHHHHHPHHRDYHDTIGRPRQLVPK